MSLRQAMDVLSFIEVIPEKQKKIMLSNFKTSPRLDRLSPYELLARYGTKPQRGFKAFVAKWLKKLFN